MNDLGDVSSVIERSKDRKIGNTLERIQLNNRRFPTVCFYCSFDFRPAIFIVRSISVMDDARPAFTLIRNAPPFSELLITKFIFTTFCRVPHSTKILPQAV
jgi:hypothetical protein